MQLIGSTAKVLSQLFAIQLTLKIHIVLIDQFYAKVNALMILEKGNSL